jgi:S1-C subfamily serine protease
MQKMKICVCLSWCSSRPFLLDAAMVDTEVAGRELIFDPVTSSADPTTINFHTRGKKPLNMGKAVAIDSRGYFLTAAHVVNDGPITVLFGEGGSSGYFAARLVWLGYNAPGQPDLALIRIEANVPATFVWSRSNSMGDTVFAVGPNLVSTKLTWKTYTKNFADSLVAGRLLSAPVTTTAHLQTFILTDDLPLHPGDSGGPLTAVQGQLIGININGQYDCSRSKPGEPRMFTSHAIRPDPAWLQQLIEEDFMTHKSSP